ncbi:siderophore ABC transporter substrate-binding protein [Macrococcus sp. DPC7161]|uniref:ferrated catecholamine ABC transporter substrate-binding lipoprotein SstD n=1 Tax=Macrococcus sp. DPC7161 TaxID=2507060 RepID=UPI00100A7452|nr:ABC transporter substrate-binding protein [Macrococcus sp. DPC7161]RXK17671.1 iron ABC transporter substrate-binding protein [Macrococcus sp. DPC7161]
MKKVSYLLVALLMVLALAACGNKASEKKSDQSGKNTIKIESNYKVLGEKKDGSDAKKVSETVEVPVNPKKVVTYDYAALTTLMDMEADKNIVGMPKGENDMSLPKFLEKYKDKKYENLGTLKEPNFEKLAEVNPELILISGRTANQKVISEMKKAAPDATILYVGTDDKDYIGSIKKNTENLGKVFDKEDKAKALNDALDKKIKEVKQMADKSKDKGLFILANEGELSVFGKGGRFGFIHDVLGVKEADTNIKAEGHGQVINFEYLNKKNPDIIFAMDRGVAVGGKSSSKKALSNDVIKNVSAIKANKIIDLDPYLWYFSSGGASTTVKQIEEVEKAYQK